MDFRGMKGKWNLKCSLQKLKIQFPAQAVGNTMVGSLPNLMLWAMFIAVVRCSPKYSATRMYSWAGKISASRDSSLSFSTVLLPCAISATIGVIAGEVLFLSKTGNWAKSVERNVLSWNRFPWFVFHFQDHFVPKWKENIAFPHGCLQ